MSKCRICGCIDDHACEGDLLLIERTRQDLIKKIREEIDQTVEQVFLNHIRLICNEKDGRPMFSLWGIPADVIREVSAEVLSILDKQGGETITYAMSPEAVKKYSKQGGKE